MNADDMILVTWTRVDTTEYTATVSLGEYSALTGIGMSALLASDRLIMPDAGPLNLADELASVEDDGRAYAAEDDCQREGIRVSIKQDDRS